MISPHSTEHPHGTQDIPTFIMISPTALNTPHGTQDIPHGTEHPHGTQDIPHGTHDIPHGTEHPHGTAHTLYRVIFYKYGQLFPTLSISQIQLTGNDCYTLILQGFS